MATSSEPPWIDLPPEITADILQRLGAEEILDSAQYVCTTWWKVSKDPAIWRTIDIYCEADEEVDTYLRKVRMSQEAVDRGQGQVIDIKIIGIQSADLIRYIAERCSKLTCLSLDFSDSEYASINYLVIKAVKKLVFLEKLHIEVYYAMRDSCLKLIEAAGNSCPMLKYFALNKKQLRSEGGLYPLDSVALAVAKWMPELRHLGLAGDMMTNQGLEAILDGCIHLESLHIPGSIHQESLDLEGEMGRRCSQQIRDLKLTYRNRGRDLSGWGKWPTTESAEQ